MGKPHWQGGQSSMQLEGDIWEKFGSVTSVLKPDPADHRHITPLLHQTFWTSWNSICSPGLLAGAQQHAHTDTHAGYEVIYIYMYLERSAVAKWQGAIRKLPRLVPTIGTKSGVFCWCSKTFLLSECSMWTRRPCSATITDTSRWFYIKSIVITIATATRIIQKRLD